MFALLRMVLAGLVMCLIASPIAAQEQQIVKGEKEPQTIKGWGEVVDPAEDCKFEAKDGKLILTVAEGTHDLNPFLGGMHAPRVIQEMNGDFTAEVKVSGEVRPGKEAATAGLSAFNGAGLLVWQDQQNFIRLERNGWWVNNARQIVSYTPLVECVQGGEMVVDSGGGQAGDFFKHQSTWFRLERKGDEVTTSYSQDGKKWVVAKKFEVDFEPKVHVGIAAINTTLKPFTVEFDEFKLTPKK